MTISCLVLQDQTFRYQEIALGAELDSVLTELFTIPILASRLLLMILQPELILRKLGYTLVDNDGYGYIGIQGGLYLSLKLEKLLLML